MYGVNILIGVEKPDFDKINRIFPGFSIDYEDDCSVGSKDIQNAVVEIQKRVLIELFASPITAEDRDCFTINAIKFVKASIEYIPEDDELVTQEGYFGIRVSSCYSPALIDYEFKHGGFAPGLKPNRTAVLNKFWDELTTILPNIKEAYLCFPLEHY